MVLLLPFSVAAIAGDTPLAATQEDTDLEEEFALLEEDIVFTASRHEQDIAESPSAISVITRQQIEYTHCTDVVCLLRQVPEVDVYRVFPAFAAVGARALTDPTYGDKMLVLVDGREITLELWGRPFLGLMSVHLQDIERIEVIRGPGSALDAAWGYTLHIQRGKFAEV